MEREFPLGDDLTRQTRQQIVVLESLRLRLGL